MINRFVHDIVNLLLYGGAFIGLCAASITVLTFELTRHAEANFQYILLIGAATAALYSAHRVIGLHKLEHVRTYERYSVIRRYKVHIWIYFILWTLISIWLFIPLFTVEFMLWLIPGGTIALGYVIPFLSKKRRLRDLGWVKIVMIGWSWAWLTAFIPTFYFNDLPFHLALLSGLERLLFIIAITIPFEIRDIRIDTSSGLLTLPSRFGLKKTIRWGQVMCFMVIILACMNAYYFQNPAYFISMAVISFLTLWILNKCASISDDYFFSGLTDGTMILALVVYGICNQYLS